MSSNNRALRTAVLVSGGGTNLQAIIDERDAGRLDIDICGVFSDRADAFGLERARRAGVPAQAVPYRDYASRKQAEYALIEALADSQPELVVLAGFMRILPAVGVETYRGRMLNVHPSLLPKYRGLNTFRRVLDAGDAWHGSTVHFVVPELDAGPSIIQYRIPVRADDTVDTLRERVQAGEYLIYPRAIEWFAAGRLALDGDTVRLDDATLDSPVVVDERD
jgi:phosphoribosylglycinamide formyltransferase-1